MQTRDSKFPFYLIIFYLFLEYARPHGLIPVLSKLHLSAITGILLAVVLVFSGRFKFINIQLKLFIFLMVLMAIHIPIAKNNYWALTICISMGMTYIFCNSISNIINNRELFAKFISVWIVIYIYIAIYGALNKGVGVGGFLVDENDYCLAINMIIPFCFFGALSSEGKKKIYYIGILCLFLFVVMLTHSRGGFVGIVAVSIFAWFRSKKKILVGLAMSLFVLFSVLTAPDSYNERINSIFEEGTERGTASERIYTWKIGWEMFLDHPILGVGQGNFNYNFREYEIEAGYYEGFYGRSRAGRAAHSIYFTVLPELGLVGTILFFGIIYYNFKDLKYIRSVTAKDKNIVFNNKSFYFHMFGLALESSMVAYLVSGTFISALYYPHIWILTGIITSLKLIVKSTYETKTTDSTRIVKKWNHSS